MAFLRCLEAGVQGPNGQSMDVPKSNPAWELIHHGWSWVVLSHALEDAIPMLCNFLQMDQNSNNSIGKAMNELGTACLMATYFKAGLNLNDATTKARQGDIKCRDRLPAIALYVQRFAGGPQFPLIHFLSTFSRSINSTLLLGNEFMYYLAHLDFKHPTNLYLMVRLAAWASQLTTHKHEDGFAKLLTRFDLDRLKFKDMEKPVLEAEAMLSDAWKTVQEWLSRQASETRDSAEAHAFKSFGRTAVRSMLFLLNKQKFSRETKQWEGLPEILQSFTEDLAEYLVGPGLAKVRPAPCTVLHDALPTDRPTGTVDPEQQEPPPGLPPGQLGPSPEICPVEPWVTLLILL